ncbi:hypothetical protein QE152_g26172 [Popillia japonica]|uniref:Uncharacterized protein n=1 Tax=Popillia japonica TaxID=7064 RepID=A0AAW1JZ34_POPJA
MAIYIVIVLLGLSHINFLSARKYHTVVKSNYQLDDLEQIDKDGNTFSVPLVPVDDDVPLSDLEEGLRLIKVNRKLLDSEQSNFEQIQEHFPYRHNGIGGRRYENPKKFQYTYSVLNSEIPKRQRGNKEINDTDFILPKREIQQIFYPERLNIDVTKNDKESAATDVKPEEIISVSSGSRSTENSSSVSSNDKDEQKNELNPNANLSVSVDKHQNNDHKIDPLHSILDPHILNNYDLLKHIYHRFLVGPIPYHFSQFQPHHLGAQPNVVNIYYDKRFMQNAPGSHSFIYSTPIEGNLPVPEPLAQVIHVPSDIHNPQLVHVPPLHVSQPVDVSPQIYEPQLIHVTPDIHDSQPINEHQPILSPQPIHLSQEVPQIDAVHPHLLPVTHLTSLYPSFDLSTSDKTEAEEEVVLKDPEPFQPINFGTDVEKDISNEYFLPKSEENVPTNKLWY